MIKTCTREIHFSAGHRVMGHEGMCRNIHGHNYSVLLTAEATELDSVGRVVDFSVLKNRIGGWIDEVWDHGFLYFVEDESVAKALLLFEKTDGKTQKMFCMPYNPTAENIAEFLLRNICPQRLQGYNVTVTEVTVWETPNCYATAKLCDHELRIRRLEGDCP